MMPLFIPDRYGEDLTTVVPYATADLRTGRRLWERAGDETDRLAIVGTHDAAAYNASPRLRCQDLTQEEQLEVGVRAFDLRLVDRYDGSGLLDLYHGKESLGLEFTEDVLPLFTQFLTAHPDEFVILSLRKEDDDHHSPDEMEAYSVSLLRALERPEVARLLYRGELTPATKVSEVRGKLLILLRTRIGDDVCMPYFDGFQDDTTFVARLVNPCGGTLDLIVEDKYMVCDTIGMRDKKSALSEVLDLAETMPDHWMIAYLSGTGDLTPEAVAEEINPFAYRLLRERTSLPGGSTLWTLPGCLRLGRSLRFVRNKTPRYEE